MSNNLTENNSAISQTQTRDLQPHDNHTQLPEGYEYRKPSFLRRMLPIIVIFSAIVVLAGLISLRKPQPATEKPPVTQLVDTVVAETRNVTYTISSQGTVEPRTETVLVPEVAGKVITLSPNFVAGGFFNAGETLLQIDPSDYRTALASAQANLAGAKALLAEEVARAEQAQKDWENLNTVIGAGTRTPSPLLLREPQLAQQRANVLSAEAEVERARRNLQRTKISLPYAGLVKERSVDLGQFVTTGNNLGVAFAVDIAEIRLPLTETDQSYLQLPNMMDGTSDRSEKPGTSVRLIAKTGRNQQEWMGRITRTEGVVDTTTRVSYAVAVVEDPYGMLGKHRNEPLRMGTFVQAEITGNQADNVIALPRASLREDGSILIANTEDQLEVRQVGIDRATPETVYINAGIEAGERIITTAIAAPIPGAPLRITGEAEPASETDEGVLAEEAQTTLTEDAQVVGANSQTSNDMVTQANHHGA